MTTLAIIGAGMAGLAAARMLHQRHPALTITLYEKSRGLGGRAGTRRRDGYIFDHGAQNIKPSPEVEQLLTHELPADALRRIAPPTWTFNGSGQLSAGDAAMNAEPTYTYADGLNRLGKLLGEGLDVRRGTRLAALRRTTNDERRTTNTHGLIDGQWSFIDTEGRSVGTADLVLLTPPAPQIIDLLAASALPSDVRDALLGELGKATYRRCLSFALAYDRPLERSFYALVNTDRQHALAWLALEHVKAPERCPPGHSLLLPQMAPQWSVDHWDLSVEEIAPLVAEHVSALLGENLRRPLWCDRQGWRYALPDGRADVTMLNSVGAPAGLFFAGDYTSEKGRIHMAIESGWRVAEEIARALG